MKTTVDILLEDIIARLDLKLTSKEQEAYKKDLTPLVENTIISVISQSLTPDESELLNQETLSPEEYQILVYDLIMNKERQKLLSKALDDLVTRLTSLPQ